MIQRCIACHAEFGLDDVLYSCRRCGELLEIQITKAEILERAGEGEWRSQPLSVWRYKPFLPISKTNPITLGEGGTRLIACRRLAESVNVDELYVKSEGENPTGSFKDRGMTVAVTKAVELGANTLVCASTGNTSSSLAAYAAKANRRCLVFIPEGKVATGKLAQTVVYGAEILHIEGGFDIAFKAILSFVSRHSDTYLLNSANPFRLEGQKTLAFEICDQLGESPGHVILPIGNAGNISAVWKGFQEYHSAGSIGSLPRMVGIQAEGASPIADAVKAGKEMIDVVASPETVASAIRIGSPKSWRKALRAIHDSNGLAEKVSDEEILVAQRELASKEGIFVEAASAASIAGLKKLVKSGVISKDSKIVCVSTGNGLKDPDVVLKGYLPKRATADAESIDRALGVSLN